MKIDIKINNDELIATNNLLQKCYQDTDCLTLEAKVFKSIGLQLADMFEKKCKKKIKDGDLFDQKKQIKIGLKFYEAWALKEIIRNFIHLSETTFQHHQIQRVINKLDKKIV